MQECPLFPQCGGCQYRNMEEEAYRRQKQEVFTKTIAQIRQQPHIAEPVFISEGTRRRAAMAFSYIKKQFKMGFNLNKSHEITDCRSCNLLTPKINDNLANIRELLQKLCEEPFESRKGKKVLRQTITQGDVLLCHADNGIDMLLEIPCAPNLNHRMIIAELVNSYPDIIRVSWRINATSPSETILEKTAPFILNSGVKVYIAAGTFLQASAEGEKALINLVNKYMQGKTGNIADLFCGIGTFSYSLSQNKNNKILAVDSTKELLEGFKTSLNRNQISNVRIETRNLFKYPLDEQELSNFDIIIFDPPRAGASAQVEKIAKAQKQPSVVIAVSCNPHTFINDANKLIDGGYTLKEVTMVDQFVYSGHTELVALFEKE